MQSLRDELLRVHGPRGALATRHGGATPTAARASSSPVTDGRCCVSLWARKTTASTEARDGEWPVTINTILKIEESPIGDGGNIKRNGDRLRGRRWL